MQWFRLTLALLVLLTLSGCAGTISNPDQTGGLVRLHVFAAPICPVETSPPDPACAPQPLSGIRLRLTDASGASSMLLTDLTGLATIRLPIGDYQIEPLPTDQTIGSPAPIEISIVAIDAIIDRDLFYDTGIR